MNRTGKCFNLTIIALLSGCNGALELTLGSYLNCIRFPLAGSIMVGINLIIYTLGYRMVPRRGTVLTMGVITALLNLFLGGSFKIWAILAIFLEALIIEIIISLSGLSSNSVIGAGVVTNLFTLCYTFFTVSVILGRGFWGSLSALKERFLGSIPGALSIYGILILVAVFHIFSGFLFGWLSWRAHMLSLRAVGWNNAGTMGQDC